MKINLSNTTNSLVKIALSSVALVASSNAAIVTWDLTDTGAGAATLDPTATGLVATAATAGPSLSTTNFTVNGFGGNEASGLLDESRTLAHAISGGQYLSFSVTPGTFGINILSFDLTIGSVLDRTSNEVALMTSVDGFNDGDEIATFTNGTVNSTATAYFDVSSYSSETTPVEFRLYLYGKVTSPNTGSNTYINNLSLTPEPTSAALLGLSGLCLIARRKR